MSEPGRSTGGPGSGIFGPIFVPDEFRAAVDGRAWVAAILEAEVALAAAQERVGLIPAGTARAISSAAVPDAFDPEELGRAGRAAGNPVPPLVRALTAAVPEPAAGYVHRGATSQDILDTAAALVARGALDLLLAELSALAAAAARLADEHRHTLLPGRTLMQQALPTTFGLKAAGWLVAAVEAWEQVRAVRGRLAAQLGGAAGTLAAFGESGVEVAREFSRELELEEPVLPWHTSRGFISELGGALARTAGVAHKIAEDIKLMAQTEVGEVAEPAGEGRGGSSTLPHKRNPILCVTAAAAASRVYPLAATLQGAMAQEHERAAGAWHTEWEALGETLALTGGATAAVREALEGLAVYPERMRSNLDLTGGLLLAENITTLAAERLGRLAAHERVQAACRRVPSEGSTLKEEVLADPDLRAALSEEEVERALDPARYLGSAGEFVDRAFQFYECTHEKEARR